LRFGEFCFKLAYALLSFFKLAFLLALLLKRLPNGGGELFNGSFGFLRNWRNRSKRRGVRAVRGFPLSRYCNELSLPASIL
jgi:hypothetical protein